MSEKRLGQPLGNQRDSPPRSDALPRPLPERRPRNLRDASPPPCEHRFTKPSCNDCTKPSGTHPDGCLGTRCGQPRCGALQQDLQRTSDQLPRQDIYSQRVWEAVWKVTGKAPRSQMSDTLPGQGTQRRAGSIRKSWRELSVRSSGTGSGRQTRETNLETLSEKLQSGCAGNRRGMLQETYPEAILTSCPVPLRQAENNSCQGAGVRGPRK